MSIKAVIFDMDGVLVDSYNAHYESFKMLARQRGGDMTAEQFAAAFGRTSREIFTEHWFEKLSPDEIQAADELKEGFYRDIMAENFPEMPGASELLKCLHASGYKLAIGSSGPPENIALVRGRLGDADLFSAAVTGMDVTRGKPDPEVFLIAAEKLDTPPKECVVVEDAIHGVQAAKSAGMRVIAITGTEDADALSAADAVIDSLNEITPEMLDALGQK